MSQYMLARAPHACWWFLWSLFFNFCVLEVGTGFAAFKTLFFTGFRDVYHLKLKVIVTPTHPTRSSPELRSFDRTPTPVSAYRYCRTVGRFHRIPCHTPYSLTNNWMGRAFDLLVTCGRWRPGGKNIPPTWCEIWTSKIGPDVKFGSLKWHNKSSENDTGKFPKVPEFCGKFLPVQSCRPTPTGWHSPGKNPRASEPPVLAQPSTPTHTLYPRRRLLGPAFVFGNYTGWDLLLFFKTHWHWLHLFSTGCARHDIQKRKSNSNHYIQTNRF